MGEREVAFLCTQPRCNNNKQWAHKQFSNAHYTTNPISFFQGSVYCCRTWRWNACPAYVLFPPLPLQHVLLQNKSYHTEKWAMICDLLKQDSCAKLPKTCRKEHLHCRFNSAHAPRSSSAGLYRCWLSSASAGLHQRHARDVQEA